MIHQVRTVKGDIRADQLGVTQTHEHLIIAGGVPVIREPEFRLDDVERAKEEVQSFIAAGGKALVDMMPIGCGRDPQLLQEISESTGAHIIAATGLHKEHYYDSLHWRYRYSVGMMAELMVHELTLGMDQYGLNGPHPLWTDIRAGVIKVASDYHYISPASRRSFEAAAEAHKATGATIATHTEMGTMGEEQADLLIGLGVAPHRIIIGHVDHNPDVEVHKRIADRGVFLQFDGFHRRPNGPDSSIVELLLDLKGSGQGAQILLAMDIARQSRQRSYGGGPGLAHILENIVPRLLRSGFDEKDIQLFLVENPRNALSWA